MWESGAKQTSLDCFRYMLLAICTHTQYARILMHVCILQLISSFLPSVLIGNLPPESRLTSSQNASRAALTEVASLD